MRPDDRYIIITALCAHKGAAQKCENRKWPSDQFPISVELRCNMMSSARHPQKVHHVRVFCSRIAGDREDEGAAQNTKEPFSSPSFWHYHHVTFTCDVSLASQANVGPIACGGRRTTFTNDPAAAMRARFGDTKGRSTKSIIEPVILAGSP